MNESRPILCLVTDRRRLSRQGRLPIDPVELLIAQLTAAVSAGIDLVQIRERDLPAGRLYTIVAHAVELARGSGSRIIVNDRLDVALAAGAAGVHLREDSMPVERVRSLAPSGFLVGRSVHDAAGAAANSGADYLAFGSVYPTRSKPDGSAAGIEALRRAVASSRVPVLAIGGVTVERATEVAAAGAAGIAGVGLFGGDESQTSALAATAGALRQAWQTL